MSDTATTLGTAQAPGNARERILEAAYDLFSRYGLRAVGVDTVIERSGVAKATLYRNFASKDDLVLEFLRLREERWTKDWLQREVERRADSPEERLLAIFDVFNDWFQRDDFEGCSFINVLVESNGDHTSAVYEATAEHLEVIRAFLAGLAEEAGIAQPHEFARRWHILMKGSIVAAQEGDREAALRSRQIGELVLARERSGLLA
jgi:AcrR family transcriptional regulator